MDISYYQRYRVRILQDLNLLVELLFVLPLELLPALLFQPLLPLLFACGLLSSYRHHHLACPWRAQFRQRNSLLASRLFLGCNRSSFHGTFRSVLLHVFFCPLPACPAGGKLRLTSINKFVCLAMVFLIYLHFRNSFPSSRLIFTRRIALWSSGYRAIGANRALQRIL